MEGEEYLTDRPVGFIWQGTARWFVARDEYVAGRGRLGVRLLGALPIVQGAGPPYDQNELLRWLAESAWLPTTLLPRGLGRPRRPVGAPHLHPPRPGRVVPRALQ
jgi:hypothetical protein